MDFKMNTSFGALKLNIFLYKEQNIFSVTLGLLLLDSLPYLF